MANDRVNDVANPMVNHTEQYCHLFSGGKHEVIDRANRVTYTISGPTRSRPI